MRLLYIALGTFAALTVAGVVLRWVASVRRSRSHPSEAIPMTPLERRAWFGLAIGLLVSSALVTLFTARGATGFYEDTRLRLTSYAIFLGGVALYAVMLRLTRAKPGEVAIDERDRRILARAPALQGPVVLWSLAAWSIGLTEVYWDTGSVPIVFPTLMFWSCVLLYLLALPASIVIGYLVGAADAES